MRTQEFRNLNVDELARKLTQLRTDYATAREAVYIGKEKNSAVLSDLRKDIARAATILREKKK